jgi:predicted DNA-binding transcriptional regulator AlpA
MTRACDAVGVARATVYRRMKPKPPSATAPRVDDHAHPREFGEVHR